ncbi:hypothetical protein [Alloscardovia criceti]|uniref:hypothetical protein n=1 Tax=Alloscardovia criceti TaxID=356828 RepID=UPI000376C849|nr:hypothetical protein [Alloscardovia criceti]
MQYDGYEEDERILNRVGLTLSDVEEDAQRVEDESYDDNLADGFYTTFHERNEPMTTISLRISKSALDALTQTAESLNLPRSEYIRRKLFA